MPVPNYNNYRVPATGYEEQPLEKKRSQQLGYSTHAVVIVDVVIVRIGIGVVIEVVTPSGPPNKVALDTIKSPPFQQCP